MTPTVYTIIEKYLKDNGYDGLCNPADEGCGCRIGDLVPCGSDFSMCQPGYLRHCERCPDSCGCFYKVEGFDYCVHIEKAKS